MTSQPPLTCAKGCCTCHTRHQPTTTTTTSPPISQCRGFCMESLYCLPVLLHKLFTKEHPPPPTALAHNVLSTMQGFLYGAGNLFCDQSGLSLRPAPVHHTDRLWSNSRRWCGGGALVCHQLEGLWQDVCRMVRIWMLSLLLGSHFFALFFTRGC